MAWHPVGRAIRAFHTGKKYRNTVQWWMKCYMCKIQRYRGYSVQRRNLVAVHCSAMDEV